MTDGLLGAWSHPADADPGAMAREALDGARPADLRLQLLRSTGDTVTVQVADGRAPLGHELLYLERRGPYDVARRESWPAGRVLLTLTAWPGRPYARRRFATSAATVSGTERTSSRRSGPLADDEGHCEQMRRRLASTSADGPRQTRWSAG